MFDITNFSTQYAYIFNFFLYSHFLVLFTYYPLYCEGLSSIPGSQVILDHGESSIHLLYSHAIFTLSIIRHNMLANLCVDSVTYCSSIMLALVTVVGVPPSLHVGFLLFLCVVQCFI